MINAHGILVRKPEWMKPLHKCLLVLINEIDLIALEAVQMFSCLSRDVCCAGYVPYACLVFNMRLG
jgi:hypothetical protein